MLALIVPSLVARLGLPSWAVKGALALIAVCLVVIAMALAIWQLRTFAENETKIAVTQASNAAKAEVAAQVNAASEEVVREQHDAQVRGMASLEHAQLVDAALWDSLDKSVSSVLETPDVPPAPASPVPDVPQVLNPMQPVGPFLPAGRPGAAPARVHPVPATPALWARLPGFAGFVAADGDADRLLERASAGAP